MGEIPFSLNYHVGKVKPAELSGIVGTGWSLTPDLGITRSVHGKADDSNQGGYPFNSQFGSTSDAYYYSASTGGLDEQPDDFFYSLLSKSGGFLYTRNGSFATLPYAAIAIDRTDDNSFVVTDDDGTRYYFGKYADHSGLLTEHTGTNESDSLINLSAWKIAEIISFDTRDTIRFTYGSHQKAEMVPFFNKQWKIAEFSSNNDYTINQKEPQVLSLPGGTQSLGYGVMRPNYAHTGDFDVSSFDFPYDLGSAPANDDIKVSMTSTTPSQTDGKHKYMWQMLGDLGRDSAASIYSNNFVFEKVLSTITFRGGRIELSYSADYQLTSIRVYAGNRLVKVVKLVQHRYIGNDDGGKPIPMAGGLYDEYCKRFLLDSVIITGSDSTQPGLRYGLSYNGVFGIYDNYQNDYWGYWKSGSSSVPHLVYHLDYYNTYSGDYSDTVSTHIGTFNSGPTWMEVGSNMETTQPPYTIPGILTQLTYPTGGKAIFTFEENEYESPAQAGRIVYGGGHRIKSIRYVTAQGQDSLVKRYTYGTTTENGWGLTKYHNYGSNFMFQQWVNTTNSSDIYNVFIKNTYINSRPFLDNSFSFGAAVLYPMVTEYDISARDNIPLGKTVYSYRINSTDVTWVNMTPIAADARNDWNSIIPLSVKQYGYANGTYYPVQSKTYTYTVYPKAPIPAAQTYLRYYSMYPLNGGTEVTNTNEHGISKYAHMDYSIVTGANKLTLEKDTLYNQPSNSGYVATQTAYTYDPAYLYKTAATTTDSRGFSKITHYWYAYQSAAVPGYSTSQQSFLTTLTALRRIAPVVETTDSINGSLAQTVRQEFLQGSNLLPGNLYTATRDNPAVPVKQILSYDTYFNIREQQGIDSVRETYLWGYNSLYPVARIIGSNYTAASALVNQSVLDNPSTTDAAMRTELNKLRTGLTGAQVWTYTYQPGIGITSTTNPQGNNTFYQYDNLGRLITILDNDMHVLKKINYNVLHDLYYNDQQSQTFTRNNCPSYDVAGSIDYTIPESSYSSGISKAAANNLALQDIQQNGQNYANTHCNCSINSKYLVAFNGNDYLNDSGWHIQLTNLLIGTTYDFAIPKSHRGFLNNIIDTGLYNVRVYKTGNTRRIFFELGTGTGHSTDITDTAVNLSNVTFINYPNDPLRIDLIEYISDESSSSSSTSAEAKSQAPVDLIESQKIERAYTNQSQASTYSYPLISMTDHTGNTKYYEYDGFGRLKDTKDKDSNVIKRYDYHYREQ
ncbi:hypothetical protein A9P82_08360 [Arachidicoccus ginsenosidimutans]|nr:hypothetical protein A9P82_08360 [Arachidicoccus sp. BS20]